MLKNVKWIASCTGALNLLGTTYKVMALDLERKSYNSTDGAKTSTSTRLCRIS